MFERYFEQINTQFNDCSYKCLRCGKEFDRNDTKGMIAHMREHALAFYNTIRKVIPPEGWDCKIFIGGCFERGVGSSFRAMGHAHNMTTKPAWKANFGWICLRAIKRLGEHEIIDNKDGTVDVRVIKPSHTLKHEYAHILAPNQGHTETWAKRLKELGANTKEYRRRYAWGNKYSTKTGKKFKRVK